MAGKLRKGLDRGRCTITLRGAVGKGLKEGQGSKKSSEKSEGAELSCFVLWSLDWNREGRPEFHYQPLGKVMLSTLTQGEEGLLSLELVSRKKALGAVARRGEKSVEE